MKAFRNFGKWGLRDLEIWKVEGLEVGNLQDVDTLKFGNLQNQRFEIRKFT